MRLPFSRPLPRLLVAGLWLATAVLAADPKAARYYEDALQRCEKKDVKGAILQLKNSLQIDKNQLPVQLLLGKALLDNGEVVAAEVAFKEALRLGVNRAEVVLPLAQSYIAQGKQAQLLEQSSFLPGGLPAGVQYELLLARAAAAGDVGDPKQAQRSIEEARAIDGRRAESWLAEVPIRIRSRQLDLAREAVARAQALAPNSPEVAYQRATVAHVGGDLRAAIADYRRTLTLQSDHLEARVTLAGLLMDMGQEKQAAEELALLHKQSPLEPRAAYLRALLASRSGDSATARAQLHEVTALLDPVPPDFLRYRPQLLMLNGLAHFGLDEREKAKPFLESFQRALPNSPATKVLAQLYLSDNNPGRAVEVLESYLRAQPGDPQAMTLLASAHMAQGRHARAASLMQEALKAKDAPEFRTALGLSLIWTGQSADALAQLEAAFKKDPGQVQAGTALTSLYLRNGQPAKAVATAESLVKRQPANAALLNLLGVAQVRHNQPGPARQSFQQALKLDATLLDAKLNLARLDILAGSLDSAAAQLAELLKADDRNIDVLIESALVADRRKLVADAQRFLEKATELSSVRDLRAGTALVKLHLREGRPGPALEVAKRVAARAPDDAPMLILLARTQLLNGDTAGTKANLVNATRLAAFDAPMQVEIAALQLQADNVSGAAYSLDKALASRPDFLPAQALMSAVELRQGEPAKAEQRAKQIAAANPKLAIGHALLGDIALSRSQPAAALEAYRRAHAAQPSTESLLRVYRLVAQQQGEKAALPLAEQWLAGRPRDLQVRSLLADGLARTQNFAGARAAYEAVLKLQPDDPVALNNLANVLLRLKDPSALKVAEQAHSAAPQSASAADTLGWAAHLNGQHERALQLLRDARLRDPANPEIRFHLATVLAQTGRREEARQELLVALKSEAFDGMEQAQVLMRSLQ